MYEKQGARNTPFVAGWWRLPNIAGENNNKVSKAQHLNLRATRNAYADVHMNSSLRVRSFQICRAR